MTLTREQLLSGAEPRASTPTISALPLTENLALYAGDDFTMLLTVTNPDGSAFDMTGCTPLSQIRVTPQADPPLASFTCTVSTNTITMILTSAASTTLPAKCVYDVQITDTGGRVQTLLAGSIAVTAQVTR
jgi:hypothetical protein